MVHVNRAGEGNRPAPCTAGTNTGTDQSTQTSGPPVQFGYLGRRGVAVLRGIGAVRRDNRGINYRPVRQSWRDVHDDEPARVRRISHKLNSSRHQRSAFLASPRAVGPHWIAFRVTREVRIISVRSGVESIHGHYQSLPERWASRLSLNSWSKVAPSCAAFFSAKETMLSTRFDAYQRCSGTVITSPNAVWARCASVNT